jgi:hypothetical protein
MAAVLADRQAEKSASRPAAAQPNLPPVDTPRFCGVLQGYFGFSTVFHQPAASSPSASRPAG